MANDEMSEEQLLMVLGGAGFGWAVSMSSDQPEMAGAFIALGGGGGYALSEVLEDA